MLLAMSHVWGHCSAACGVGAGLFYIWGRNPISVTGDGLFFAGLSRSLGWELPLWGQADPHIN